MGKGHSSPPHPGYSVAQTAAQNGTMLIKPVDGIVRQVSITKTLTCGIGDGEGVWCTPTNAPDGFKWNPLENTRLKQISMDTVNGTVRACGVNNDDNIYCASDVSKNNWIQVGNPPDKLYQVSLSGNRLCGVNHKNELKCADFGISNWSDTPGSFKYISLDGIRACGTGPSGNITCTENIDYPTWNPIPGNLANVILSNGRMCGAGGDLVMYCGDYDSTGKTATVWTPYASGVQFATVFNDVDTEYIYVNDKDRNPGRAIVKKR